MHIEHPTNIYMIELHIFIECIEVPLNEVMCLHISDFEMNRNGGS